MPSGVSSAARAVASLRQGPVGLALFVVFVLSCCALAAVCGEYLIQRLIGG